MYTLIMITALGAMPHAFVDDADAVPRPAWLEFAERGMLPAHSEVVKGELWATPDAARDDVLEKASDRALEFAAEVAPRLATRWHVPTWLVREQMLKEPIYVEEIEAVSPDWHFGPMYRAHLLIDLAPAKRDVLLATWHGEVLHERLGQIGGGAAFIFICLVTLFGYLRLDDATRGYYSKWLITGAATLVAGSAAVLYTWVV